MAEPGAGPRLAAVVLAAGLGKRMRSTLPKVLHEVGGRPMLLRVLDAVAGAGLADAVVVVGNGGAAVRAAGARGPAGLDVRFAEQAEQRGTGDAARCGLEVLQSGPGPVVDGVLIVPGDTPLLTAGLLEALVREYRDGGADATLLTAHLPDPSGYGRVARDAEGRVRAIVEDRDASPAERAISEVNSGVACFRLAPLVSALFRCQPANAQGEIYLTDVVGLLYGDGRTVTARAVTDPALVLGVNDRVALADAEAAVRRRVLERAMRDGVTIIDPATTYIDEAARIGPDTVIRPQTLIEGPCVVGSGCTLGPGTHLIDSVVGPECTIGQSVVEESILGPGCTIGPFAHLRAGTQLGARVMVGNFAELKSSRVGDGTKQHHHSYIGDADVGSGVNVGAGVITVNFDGRAKHRTVIGDGAFLGCNANLVAPVEVGAGAFVAAGTSVTKPVPPDALVVGRAQPVVKEGWARHRLRGEDPAPSGSDRVP